MLKDNIFCIQNIYVQLNIIYGLRMYDNNTHRETAYYLRIRVLAVSYHCMRSVTCILQERC